MPGAGGAGTLEMERGSFERRFRAVSIWITRARRASLATDTADGNQLFPTKLHPYA